MDRETEESSRLALGEYNSKDRPLAECIDGMRMALQKDRGRLARLIGIINRLNNRDEDLDDILMILLKESDSGST